MQDPLIRLFAACGVLIVPLILAGPAAALHFYREVVKKNGYVLLRFWLLLLLISFVSFILIIATYGHSWPWLGYYVARIIPFAAIISLTILLVKRKPYWEFAGDDKRWHTNYMIGVIFIPLLQLIVGYGAPEFVDSLCKWLPLIGYWC